MWPFKCKSWSY